MSDETHPDGADAATAKRKFLCVVDGSRECAAAVHFAARRAKHTGGNVALLFVIEPGDFQHWAAVKDIMREEARDEAEEVLKALATQVMEVSQRPAELVIKEGEIKGQILALIEQDRAIGVLVLGAASGKDGPGPLVSSLASRDQVSPFLIPVTVVPGHLTPDEIDSLA